MDRVVSEEGAVTPEVVHRFLGHLDVSLGDEDLTVPGPHAKELHGAGL